MPGAGENEMPRAADGDSSRRRRRGGSEATPAQRAMALLVRREHSRKELRGKLAQRGIASADAEAAIDQLAAAGWQDDARFAESLVRSRANAGYGPLRIRAELATHGLEGEAITRAMQAHTDDWAEAARRLVLRRFGEAQPQDPALERERWRKAADFLLRRGFSMEHVRSATGNGDDD